MELTSDRNSYDSKCDNDVASLTPIVLPACMWVNHVLIPSVPRLGTMSSTVYSHFDVFSHFGGRE